MFVCLRRNYTYFLILIWETGLDNLGTKPSKVLSQEKALGTLACEYCPRGPGLCTKVPARGKLCFRPPVPVTCLFVGFLHLREPLSLIPLGLCWFLGHGVEVCCYLLKGKQTNKTKKKTKTKNKNLGRTKLLGSGFRLRAPFHLQNKSPLAAVPRGLTGSRVM